MNFNLSDLPTGVVLFLLGLACLLVLNKGIINFLKGLTGKKLRYITHTSTRIILVIVGVILVLSGPLYVFYDQDIGLRPTCIYSAAAKTDEEAITWLVEHEAQAVVAEDMDLIKGIFADEVTIVDHFNRNSPEKWITPLQRYQPLFRDYDFFIAENTHIKAVGSSNGGATQYYISGSHGEYKVNGETHSFQNADDASHRTVTKIGGCWKITTFDFNASGIPFP